MADSEMPPPTGFAQPFAAMTRRRKIVNRNRVAAGARGAIAGDGLGAGPTPARATDPDA